MALRNPVLKRPLTITVANNKGGVGKTSIIRYLSFSLAIRGYRVCVVDGDPQANTTKSLIITRDLYTEDDDFVLDKTMMAGVRDGNIKDIRVNVMNNLDIVPSHIDFKKFPTFLNKRFGVAEQGDPEYHEIESQKLPFMKNLIDPFKEEYDFILIDTPPTASDWTRTASFASDYIIIAFQTQSDSLDGAVQYIQDELTELVNDFGAKTDVLGILPNQVSSKGSIDTEVVEDAKEIFGEQNLFKNIIPYKKRIQSAPRNGLRKDGYWDKELFTHVIDPLTDDFLNRVKIMEDLEEVE
ncbi:ParA family protein [Listeria monocytogenes]|uniref:ParA family protein n=1 Tax=Listeria monocytogenes TaxID=1639 RepID=UPI00083CB4DA|nr:ParA family protein [Listeria monocytogenes]EAC2557533.1 ParA family protein [Listeria monocytogenes]EAC4520859.1 ParA family protein [Listeria monocytogenes]EAE8113436.1 ParA family protein [Listeria monocytogenes]EAE8240954.1 ParA family protein [Listeria monocytogenes]EAF0758323.1 ParA family protein [Listeria monocytogenes]